VLFKVRVIIYTLFLSVYVTMQD